MSRKTIFVMGMGRSGTSTVAGVLQKLGIEWGASDKWMVSPDDNVRGFYEFVPLYEINVEILRRHGGNWHVPPKFLSGWEKNPLLSDLLIRAQEIISSNFQTDLWGFKDPRCCLTMPFWRLAIENPIDCVFVFRNPLEVAFSLFKRDDFPIELGISLWLMNVMESWRTTQDLRRHFLFYEDILNDPAVEIERLERFIGRKFDGPNRDEAIRFVGQELRHQHVSFEEFLAHEQVSHQVKELYAALRTFVHSQKQESNEGQEVVDYLLSDKARFQDAFASCRKASLKLLSTYQPPPPSGR